MHRLALGAFWPRKLTDMELFDCDGLNVPFGAWRFLA